MINNENRIKQIKIKNKRYREKVCTKEMRRPMEMAKVILLQHHYI